MDADYALFAQVVAAGSLAAAGRALGISPAMVSKRIARLEARLGARLIHRTTRRLTLTEIGARFHEDIVDVLDRARRAEERVSGATRAPAGRLRVSMPTSFGRLHVAPALPRFLTRYPAVELAVDLSDGFVDLLADRVDLAIRITAEVPASVVAHRLAASPRILCAAPAYLAEHGAPRTVAELRGHNLLAADGQMPWTLTEGPRRASVDQRSRVRTNSSELVRELAVVGAGIALRSLWDVDGALGDGSLVRVLPTWQGASDVGIYAVHPGGGPVPPAVAAFVGFLDELFKDASWGRSV